MPLAKHRSPFARRLLLSELESADLTHRARALVADAVADYEQFLWRQHGTVTPTQWTLERDKDDVRLYHGRRGGSSSQELLAVGAVHGELDDALFGVLGVTTEALRLRAAYTKDRLSNGAVLATFQRPTRSEPFRALTVKWLVSGEPLHVRALAVGKKSDVVALEATGMSALSNGETVGFLVLHSVDLPQAPPLQAYERASVSVCALWRQASDDRVQLYARGVVGGAGDKSRGLARATRATGGALLCLSRAVHCAQMKKLAWLLRCKAAQLGGRRGLHDLHHRTSSSSSSERACEVCPSQMALSGRRSAKGACVVCARLVCSDCRVKRELCSIALDDRLLEQRVAFCVPCHTIAARAAAADVASDEATAYSVGDVARASQAPASLVHTPGLAHDDGDGDGDHRASDAGSPRMDAPRRVRGFGDDDDDEDVGDDDDDDDGGSDDHIDDVDRVFKPRKSLQTSSMAGTLEADDDELEGARRARPASGLAPAFMLGR